MIPKEEINKFLLSITNGNDFLTFSSLISTVNDEYFDRQVWNRLKNKLSGQLEDTQLELLVAAKIKRSGLRIVLERGEGDSDVRILGNDIDVEVKNFKGFEEIEKKYLESGGDWLCCEREEAGNKPVHQTQALYSKLCGWAGQRDNPFIIIFKLPPLFDMEIAKEAIDNYTSSQLHFFHGKGYMNRGISEEPIWVQNKELKAIGVWVNGQIKLFFGPDCSDKFKKELSPINSLP